MYLRRNNTIISNLAAVVNNHNPWQIYVEFYTALLEAFEDLTHLCRGC
jgi:hypothetical protein